MTDIPADADTLRRKERAAAIMGDPMVVEAFETIEKEFSAVWMASNETDAEGRERLYRMLWASRRFKAFFAQVMDEGSMHQWQVEQLKRGQL